MNQRAGSLVYKLFVQPLAMGVGKKMPKKKKEVELKGVMEVVRTALENFWRTRKLRTRGFLFQVSVC